MAIPTIVPINKIRLNTTRSSGIEEPQIGFDTRIVILRSDEIRLHYFDSRMREHVGVDQAAGLASRTQFSIIHYYQSR
jgi:hypothetical protein